MEHRINVSDKIQRAEDPYGQLTSSSQPVSRAKRIAYWVITAFITFELVYGALWDFNVLNQGYAYKVLGHLGYPVYLAAILGICKLIAATFILLPGFWLLKEWAYTGLVILFMGAFVSHLLVGDSPAQYIWAFLFGLLVIGSWVLRPANRRIAIGSLSE